LDVNLQFDNKFVKVRELLMGDTAWFDKCVYGKGQNGRQGIEQVDAEMGSAGGKEGNGKINYVEKFLNKNPRN
jgi:hypothetical protein